MALEYRGPRAYASAGVDGTVHLGELVAGCLEDGDVLVLTGGRGVGKTHFCLLYTSKMCIRDSGEPAPSSGIASGNRG